MPTISKISLKLFITVFMAGSMLFVFADRGFNKKGKAKITLNISTNYNFKKALSLNLKNGLKYKGSLINIPTNSNFSGISNNLVTYQKGNTIYIIPSKQKIIVSEIKQGYTGMKLIINAH